MARSTRSWGTLAGVAAAGIGLAWSVGAPHGRGSPGPTEVAPAPGASAAAPAGPPSPTAAPLPAPAESLRDTDVDGALTVGPDGRFVPDRGALATFDYFLAATGEEPAETIRARILAHAHATLPTAAAAEAVAFLDRYLAYRERARALAMGGAAPPDLERRFQWIRELRREHFGAALAETLFGEEEAVLRVDLERRRVSTDASLASDDRARRLAALEAELPERVREARRRATAVQRVEADVEALRAAGGTEAEVFAARERAFGREAAERLGALDVERASFRARLAAHRADRDAIAEDPGLTAAEKETAIEALRVERFDERERLRVRALDRSERPADPRETHALANEAAIDQETP